MVVQCYLKHLLFSQNNAYCRQDILCQTAPKFCFSNIKHKGKTLTASVVINPSPENESSRQEGADIHAGEN